MLFLYQKRYLFNKDNQKSYKVNDRFEFEKEIYVDRFLEENKEKSKCIQKQVHDIVRQIEELSAKLAEVKNYKVNSLFLLVICSNN